MLDVIALIYITISTLSLLGIFPIGTYEFLDARAGFAISDYGLLFETSAYFNISTIFTGLLCGLDSITNPSYKKVNRLLYNYHALASFGLIGVGFFPLDGSSGWPTVRILHWFAAFVFLFIYPATRLFVLRYFDEKKFKQLSAIFVVLSLASLLTLISFNFTHVAYPEYIMWVSLLSVIVLSKFVINKKENSVD